MPIARVKVLEVALLLSISQGFTPRPSELRATIHSAVIARMVGAGPELGERFWRCAAPCERAGIAAALNWRAIVLTAWLIASGSGLARWLSTGGWIVTLDPAGDPAPSGTASTG